MAINLTLQAAPAFDRSIVPAFQVNFNRIRDALLHASMQTSFVNGLVNGGWPQTVNVNVPYKCDILLWCEISFWDANLEMVGVKFKWDGVDLSWYADQYNNIANVHLTDSVINEIRGVAAGSHTLQAIQGSGTVSSDGNDRWRWCAVFFEVV
jgi:hypothetical protein